MVGDSVSTVQQVAGCSTRDPVVRLFGQRTWQEAAEFMAQCNTKWAMLLLTQIALVETDAPCEFNLPRLHLA